jgi:Zn-dependent protease with chaperone function
MDFFEAQARAKKRTTRLVVLFAFAVAGTIAAAYFAAVFGFGAVGRGEQRRHARSYDYSDAPAACSLWQPRLFAGVSLVTLAIIGLASLVKWNEFSSGGSAVARSVGGRRVNPHTTDLNERRLLNVVEEMAIASGVPVPDVYILDDEPSLNAFAAGLTTGDAVIAVNRGTIEKLTRDELQGVIGHEFSHILNGDMRLNLRITAIIFGILVLGVAGRGILWALGHGRFRGGKNSGGIVIAVALAGLALLLIGYVGYFFGRLIQAAVSRQREFLADASSVQFTRNPAGLAGALKKIGGYALGSTMQSTKSTAIGHFFFAQAFRSNFGGLWATHPPLAERIRSIDPQWDGTMFAPPNVVNVERESFNRSLSPVSAFDAPLGESPLERGGAQRRGVSGSPSVAALSAVSAIGTLTPAQLANAQLLLEAVPARLRDASRSPDEAPALLCALLLDADPVVRARQRALVTTHAGDAALVMIDELDAPLRALGPEHKLPLVQLALPALRNLPPAQLPPFLETLDELVHADGRVTAFEFALQKLLTRALALGETPARAVVQIYSFNAVTAEISAVLSVLAHAATSDPAAAKSAFAAGAAQLKLIEGKLAFSPASDFAALDAALDKLATASGPIKQRTLVAAAHVVSADGRVLITEGELLRAIAATLDCPMPPLAA